MALAVHGARISFAANLDSGRVLILITHLVWFQYFYIAGGMLTRRQLEVLYQEAVDAMVGMPVLYQNYCAARRAMCEKVVRYQESILYSFATNSMANPKIDESTH